jgi:hypothetical protein
MHFTCRRLNTRAGCRGDKNGHRLRVPGTGKMDERIFGKKPI